MATGMKIAPIEHAALKVACFDSVAEEVGAVDLPGTFGLRVDKVRGQWMDGRLGGRSDLYWALWDIWNAYDDSRQLQDHDAAAGL